MKLAIGVVGSSGGTSVTPCGPRRTGWARRSPSGRPSSSPEPARDCPTKRSAGRRPRAGWSSGSPRGASIDEHRGKYGSPVEGFDVLVYTGSGLMGREITNIRSCDIVVIVGGRTGTLGELAIAYDEGRLIGVLTGTGGITEIVETIIRSSGKETGACVLYDDDPNRLIDRLIQYYRTSHVRKPSCFCDARGEG